MMRINTSKPVLCIKKKKSDPIIRVGLPQQLKNLLQVSLFIGAVQVMANEIIMQIELCIFNTHHADFLCS